MRSNRLYRNAAASRACAGLKHLVRPERIESSGGSVHWPVRHNGFLVDPSERWQVRLSARRYLHRHGDGEELFPARGLGSHPARVHLVLLHAPFLSDPIWLLLAHGTK